MNLFEILRLECITAGAELKDKTVTLHEIARIAKKCHVFDNVTEDQIISGLEEREKLGELSDADIERMNNLRIALGLLEETEEKARSTTDAGEQE